MQKYLLYTDKWQLYFSTDDSMDGREVLDYYITKVSHPQ